MGIFQSLRKSRRLWKVSKRLNKSFDPAELLRGKASSEKEGAFEELLDICACDDLVRFVMTRYEADNNTLRDLFDKLCRNGAGVLVGGHYVAASSLAFPLPLKFLLEHYREGAFVIRDYDDHDSSLFVANRLVQYFELGETGEVRC